MKTIDLLKHTLESIPITTSWYLSAIDEFKGKHEIYNKQSPQKLTDLEKHALIESSISSNRMEGAHIAHSRIETVVFGNSLLKDRDEEEVRGYQKALRWVHEQHNKIEISIDTILNLHKMIRGENSDAGEWKVKKTDIIGKLPDGKQIPGFKSPDVKEGIQLLEEAIKLWNEQINEKRIPPLILLAAFNFDFLCIHPFQDGNGRVSRLLLLLQLYKLGYDIGRYISIERIIEENKERYYESLQQSSVEWSESRNTVWPYTNYLLFILKEAYNELEKRLENLPDNYGSKTYIIMNFINNYMGQFSLPKIKYYLPGIGMDLIRKILKELQKEGKIRNLGRGINAKWIKL
jgi:Fic family protein